MNRVSNHLKVLDEAHRLRERLDGNLRPLVFRKVNRMLVPTINGLGEGALDDAALTKIRTEWAS